MRLEQLRKDYCLLEAFEALGEWLYGDEWTGNELKREWHHVTDPEELAAKRAPYEAELAEIDEEHDRLRKAKSKTVKKKEVDEYAARLEELLARRAEITHFLWENPAPEKGVAEDWEEWHRRVKTEGVLISGLAAGDLMAVSTSNLIVENYLWKERDGFRYYIDLSMVVLPQRSSSQKRHNVRIPEGDFDKWLRTVTPVNSHELRKLSREDRCKIFLKEKVLAGPKEKLRDEYFDDACELIPSLAYNEFRRAWAESTPRLWRRAGRPPKILIDTHE